MNKITAFGDLPKQGFSIPEVSVPDGLAFAAKQSGRGVIDISREYMRLSRGRGKITMAEYCMYRLYDSEKYTDDEKSRFIAEHLHWQIAAACSDTAWFAAVEDKWLTSAILSKATLITPENLAVYDTSQRNYGTDLKISTAGELKAFLTGKTELPVFVKPVRGIASFGAVQIAKADDNHIEIHSGEKYGYEEFIADVLGDHAYLIQTVIDNHDFIKKYTPHTATLRLQNMVMDDGISTPFALIKIPAKHNVADNFWRDGNIICSLDTETGEIRNAMSGGVFEQQHYTKHPETGEPLVGEIIPMWDDIRKINKECVKLFLPIKYQSLDIAITPKGPMIVEINFGGSMLFLQLASGRGYLTDEAKAFFSANGCDLFEDGKKKKKKR